MSGCQAYSNSSDGVRLDAGSHTLVNCLVYNNASNGVLVTPGPATVSMWHCTINGNTLDGFQQFSGTGTIRNCIFTSNLDDGIDLDGGTIDHTYSLLWGNTTNYEGTSPGTGEISSNPQFVSATNFHLRSNSPAIDAGTNASSQTTEDLDGGTRPKASGWDMGCYEGASGTPRILAWREVAP
jgi:hypothetical protein